MRTRILGKLLNSEVQDYLKRNDRTKAEEYVRMMLEEQQALKEKRVNFNLVEAIVDLSFVVVHLNGVLLGVVFVFCHNVMYFSFEQVQI